MIVYPTIEYYKPFCFLHSEPMLRNIIIYPRIQHNKSFRFLRSKRTDPKQINSIHKRTIIILITRQIHPIPRNHIRRTYGINVIQSDITTQWTPLNTQDTALASRSSALLRAIGAVVGEE